MSMKPVLSRQGGGKGVKKASQDTIRGIPQSEIDAKRGYRDHVGVITPQMIRDDYKRVGIDITLYEASKIQDAIFTYTSVVPTNKFREALDLHRAGKSLTSEQKDLVEKMNRISEYLKVAPTYRGTVGSSDVIYRGKRFSNSAYHNMLLSKKVGETFNIDMPSSFSTDIKIAKYNFSSRNGIIFHVHNASTRVRNGISIMGLSQFQSESEVFVSSQNWKLVKIEDNRNVAHDYRYHMYLEPAD